MRLISKFLLLSFVVSILVEFALLQYVASNFPPQLDFQSNLLNEQKPFKVDKPFVKTTAAPLETSINRRLTRGSDSILNKL